jgi:hypothetical protein
MTLLAIDPGPEESAYVIWDGSALGEFGKMNNQPMRDLCWCFRDCHTRCVIEKIASFGMPVGAEVFETCVWTGRFMETFGAERCDRITRIAVKNHLCHSSRAKDANIRQALIDRLGAVGTKKDKGPLYGVSGDVWSALAVAVTWWDLNGAGESRRSA